MSDPNNYTIGWISALEIEYVAAQEFLDEEHEGPKWVHRSDENHYTLGRIGNHNVVIAVLPRGDNGVAAAAMAAKDMMHTFPNVRVCLMVGIGGGAPSKRHDIRLGDVIVSVPTFSEQGGNQGGVIQYDYGRTIQKRCFQGARYLNRPPRALLTAVTGLSTKYKRRGNSINTTINNILQSNQRLQKEYERPDSGSDKLYSSESLASKLIERPERSKEEDNPAIHYGLIASADGFMEDAQIRDILAEELDVLCFEMEAAGLMNSFPCLVIRGICDYSDRHWFKEWRGYAAMAAAAYANALLEMLPASDVDKMQTIKDLLLPPDIMKRAKDFIAPLWGDRKNETISISADSERTQTTNRSKGQSTHMLPSQAKKSPPVKTDITGGRIGIKHVYIAVMGVTGAGKSSLISLCTGKNVKIGHNLESCTADVEDVEFMINDHVCVHLIDTPGFDDTSRSDVEVLQNIAVWLSDSFEQGIKLSGIIYLHRIIDVRMAGSALRNLSMFKKLCGENAYSSVVLATSMWSLVDEAIGVQREQELIETKKFWGYMHEKGSRIFRLDRTRDSCLAIIRYILSLGSTTILELQDEIVNQGCQIEDTEAGAQLNEDIIRERKKHQAELLGLKQQMKETAEMAEHDTELQRALEEEYEGLKENIRCNDEEQAKLKQDLKDIHERKDREFRELHEKMEADRRKYEDDMCNQEDALKQQAREYQGTSDTATWSVALTSAPPVPPTESITTMESRFGESVKQNDQNNTQSTQEMVEQDISDTATEYSDESSAAFPRRQNYIWELAEDIFKNINTIHMNQNLPTNMSETLSDLLQAFALMVGHNAPTQMHRDIMAFVHRYRREIATAFIGISFEHDEEPKRITDNENAMTLEDRMNLWLDHSEEGRVEEKLEDSMVGDDQAPDEFAEETAETEDEEVPDNWLRVYREFILQNEIYEWLLGRLRRELHLVPTQPNTIQAIRDSIMSSLPSCHRVSRKVSSQSYNAMFEINWDIFGFFETQGYLKQWSEVFEGVITLTGSSLDAQAATCAQYIRQTWPLTGEVMIQLVKSVLRGEEGHLHHCTLPDQTTLTAWINGSKFMVKVYGIAASVAETGEQLAWLGAALRTSPRRNRLTHCTPTINIYQNSPQVRQSKLQLSSTNIIYEIGFTVEKALHPRTRVNGQCWHAIFRNPVIVRGYPIPRRIEWNTGLEISLNIMAGLAQTQQINQFKEKIYIKGFSIMIIPIRQTRDFLYWHLIYQKNGHRVSYLDDNIRQEKQDIKRTDLESLRHILGWCSDIKFYAGTAQAHHPVTHSELPKPPDGCALAGVKVLEGEIVRVGPAYITGAKDTPVQISRKPQGYVRRLEWLSTKFILLWDEEEKRGWLINGTSALLHLMQAFLKHASEGKLRSIFIFKNKDLQNMEKPYTAESAITVLGNRENWRLKLYEEDDDDFKSQINNYIDRLEKLIDHQVDIAGDCGIKLKNQPRKYLEGWDFEDLTKELSPLSPRIATLEADGKGWVDFIRAIHAVTLVGRGFGDIIRPTGTNLCKYWAQLPKQRYYVASCLSDLSRLIKDVGNRKDGYVWLTDNVICHTPTSIFMSCQCGDEDALGRDHCEPVQTLLPSVLLEEIPPKCHQILRHGAGAIIFGQHSNFSWIWGDNGDPRKGNLIQGDSSNKATEDDLDSLQDSGIGESLALPVSEGHISFRSKSNSGQSIVSPSEVLTHARILNPIDSIDKEPYTRNQYTVGIICALSKELMAVRALFDHRHAILKTIPGDSNQYSLGEMEGHLIVAACLPAKEYGTNSAAAVAAKMSCSFPGIRFCLLVGIAGGVPSERRDIRLGDVVVSLPTGTNSGVLQYDLGKQKEDSPFELTGMLQRPPRVLTTAISSLDSDPDLRKGPLGPNLSKIIEILPDYKDPGKDLDILDQTCAECIAQRTSPDSCPHNLQRMPRTPHIHYGQVASGNRVIKDAKFRDQLARECDTLCFEMEAAGVVNDVGCLVIRGICDYCDTQKNDAWQKYAAATAAAYAKLLLSVVAKVEDNDST